MLAVSKIRSCQEKAGKGALWLSHWSMPDGVMHTIARARSLSYWLSFPSVAFWMILFAKLSTSKDCCNEYGKNTCKSPNTLDSDSIFMAYLSTAAFESSQIPYQFSLVSTHLELFAKSWCVSTATIPSRFNPLDYNKAKITHWIVFQHAINVWSHSYHFGRGSASFWAVLNPLGEFLLIALGSVYVTMGLRRPEVSEV